MTRSQKKLTYAPINEALMSMICIASPISSDNTVRNPIFIAPFAVPRPQFHCEFRMLLRERCTLLYFARLVPQVYKNIIYQNGCFVNNSAETVISYRGSYKSFLKGKGGVGGKESFFSKKFSFPPTPTHTDSGAEA